ncbi:MAG: hypothetical protein JSU95_13245 [Betaproteobacteria bacterium]|nr:MAG: hypothetical protein JSU95_13245 [Betaproteobacteria bacterium]
MLVASSVDVLLRPSEIRVTKRSALSLGLPGRFSSKPVAAETGVEPWKPCIDALSDVLAGLARTVSLDVVLSDHFLRYALVPWSRNLVADSERLALARLTFSQIYGSMVDDWVVTVGEQKAGQAAFACAMDRGLLQALQELARRRSMRLRSLRTALGERINRHRRRLRQNEFCFASLEPERLTLAFHSKAGWLAVRGRRLAAGAVEQLPAVVRQEAAAAGANQGGDLYLASELPAEALPAEVAGWRLVRLYERVPAQRSVAGTSPVKVPAD